MRKMCEVLIAMNAVFDSVAEDGDNKLSSEEAVRKFVDKVFEQSDKSADGVLHKVSPAALPTQDEFVNVISRHPFLMDFSKFYRTFAD